MEIASLLWSISSLNVAANPDRAALSLCARAAICGLASAPAVREGEWSGHSLCLLANALYPVRSDLAVTLWTEVEMRWVTQLSALAVALTSFESLPVDSFRYGEGLRDTGCFHAGPHYTQRLLAELGISEASRSFTMVARCMVDDARSSNASAPTQSKGTSAAEDDAVAGIICVLCYSLDCASGAATTKGRQLFVSESRASSPPSEVVQGEAEENEDAGALLVPVYLAHDRSGHAEFLALSQMMGLVAGVVKSSGGYGLQNVTGSIRLYVTHHPCLSCVGVMSQLRSALPNVAVEVSYDWRPATGRGL